MFTWHILHFAIDGLSDNTPFLFFFFYILETQDSDFYSTASGSIVEPTYEQ